MNMKDLYDKLEQLKEDDFGSHFERYNTYQEVQSFILPELFPAGRLVSAQNIDVFNHNLTAALVDGYVVVPRSFTITAGSPGQVLYSVLLTK